MSTSDEKNQSPWERQTIEKLLFTMFNEQRRARRWKIFFRILLVVLIIMALWPDREDIQSVRKSHVAIIDINGIIMPDSQNSSENIIKSLTRAFADSNTRGIILRINSPGGSPVQSDDIYTSIRSMRQKYPKIPVYAVCEDMCASGAYYVASAADEIEANPSSIVGSIGVLMNGFGFVDAMQKIGVERRLLTAGENKAMLDPFSPENPKQTAYVQQLLEEVHQVFINRVKEGRGSRLKSNDPIIFSGLFWTGTDAKKLGLIDGFLSTRAVVNTVFHTQNIVNYTVKENFLDKLAGNVPADLSNAAIAEYQKLKLQLF